MAVLTKQLQRILAQEGVAILIRECGFLWWEVGRFLSDFLGNQIISSINFYEREWGDFAVNRPEEFCAFQKPRMWKFMAILKR